MNKHLTIPLSQECIDNLNVGESILLNGKIIVMRDAAHKRIIEQILSGACKVDFKGSMIYYMGPCPAAIGEIIGSCGPTTSSRMDSYAPLLYDKGAIATIGKGERNSEVIAAIVRNHAMYLAAIGGCGALYKDCIARVELIDFPELGAEAMIAITVKDFPVIVAIDCRGNSVY